MLYTLSVKNFAIIEDIKVDFQDGMTVLTGETGAGKSLIIDSIGLLLGDRADSDMVRYGTDKAYIEGVFDYDNEKINDILERNSIPKNDKLKIYREISTNGRNVVKVNDVSITLQELKNIKIYLADIHVQHDTFRLINPDTYLSFIDNSDDDSFTQAFNDYQIYYDKYLHALNEYRSLNKRVELSKERLEFLVYERDELNALNLYPNKDIEIEEKINKLSNFDKIYKSLNEAYGYLEGDLSSIDSIYNAYKSISNISEYDELYNKSSEVIYDAYSNLSDVKSDIYKAINSLDYNEEELNLLQEELNNINNVKNKYKKNLDELLSELEKISHEIDLSENFDMVVEEYKKNVINAFNILKDKSNNLTNIRKKRAISIEDKLILECRDLELSDIQFKILFNDVSYDDPFNSSIFLSGGVDVVSFMISLNKGEPMHPLHKVASGGELSRIMLAFKSIFASEAKLSLIVFDEIDTGVSGSAAIEIARKMKNISKYMQVLCITHLPAVASSAKNQIYISKLVDNGRTKTKIEYLSYDDRVSKLAMMIGGNKISKMYLDAAREMLEENK